MIRDLGSALIKFREDLGMTRKEFYEKVGISKVRLSQLENNKYNESEKVITSILQHFNVSYYDFLIVYGGHAFNGHHFDSFDELAEYRKHLSFDPLDNDYDESEIMLHRFLDNMDYLQTEASEEELNTVMDLIDFYKFKKYDKKDYLQWLVERSKEQK